MSDALYEVNDAVATVKMNRPDRMNSLTHDMLDLLVEHLRAAAADPAVRCVVLTGAGDRAFSAGADLAPSDGAFLGPDAALEPLIDSLQRQHETAYLLHTMSKPTIAAVNGSAAGASLSMALACDFRVAVEGVVLRTAFTGIGFSGDFGGSYFLTHLVGSARARELMMLGDKIRVGEPEAAGLVTKVSSRESFQADVAALAARFTQGPPLSYRYMKRNLNLVENGAHLRDLLDLEAEAMMRTGTSKDFAGAVRAFLKKEAPSFEGR